MIYQKIYTSMSPQPMDDTELALILDVSRINNARDGLSGLLVTHENRFFQVLEGPQAQVTSCYDRIAEDPRHTKVRMLSATTVPERVFSEWRMGFARPEELASNQRDAVFSIHKLAQGDAVDVGTDDRVARLVRSFLASFGLLGVAGAHVATARPGEAQTIVRNIATGVAQDRP